jgi:hypothetical protein
VTPNPLAGRCRTADSPVILEVWQPWRGTRPCGARLLDSAGSGFRLGSSKQPTLNPRVQDSSPWRAHGMTWGFSGPGSSFCVRFVRFPGRAGSVLARRSDVGRRAACQKRANWSRPDISIPADAATQRDIRRNKSYCRAIGRWRHSWSLCARPASGLNPHLCRLSPPRVVPDGHEQARVNARLPQTGGRSRRTEVYRGVHRRYIYVLACQYLPCDHGRRPAKPTPA